MRRQIALRLLGLLLLVGCTSGGRPSLPPIAPALPYTPGLMIDAGASGETLDLALDLGFRHVRVATWMDWYEAERLKLSGFYQGALERGLRPLLVTTSIDGPCEWDVTQECIFTVASWHAGLVRAFPHLDGLEVLNEVTAHAPFAGDYPDAEKARRIAPLFCAVADSVRAVTGDVNNPRGNAKVMLGVGGTSDEYLGVLKEAGALDCTDVMVIHGYQEIAPQVAQIRKYTDKPIWVTECGADTWDDALHLEVWQRCFDAHGVERVYGFALADVNAFGIMRDGEPRAVVPWLRDLLKEAP